MVLVNLKIKVVYRLSLLPAKKRDENLKDNSKIRKGRENLYIKGIA